MRRRHIADTSTQKSVGQFVCCHGCLLPWRWPLLFQYRLFWLALCRGHLSAQTTDFLSLFRFIVPEDDLRQDNFVIGRLIPVGWSVCVVIMEVLSMERVTFCLNIRRMSVVVMSVPLIGIIVCFVSACILHEDINKTRCPVYNFIPSVSAVTGVSPQCYLWRLCVALHLVPRGLFTWLGRQHAMTRGAHVAPATRRCYCRLVSATFALGVGELLSLAGVTFVSNKENYPLHEKMFALFIGCCTWYMIVSLAAEWLALSGASGDGVWPARRRSFWLKCGVFCAYTWLVLGLLYNFWKHRVYCQELAFSWFSLCEYCICVCIMVFHLLVLRDVPDMWLAVGCVASDASAISLHPSEISPDASAISPHPSNSVPDASTGKHRVQRKDLSPLANGDLRCRRAT